MRDGRRAVATARGQRVHEETRVVALVEGIEPHVRAARLLALQRRVRHRLGDLEHAVELDRRQPFGVEGAAAVVQPHAGAVARAQRGQRVAGGLHAGGVAEDADAALHAGAQRVAQHGHALATLLPQQRQQAGFGGSSLVMQSGAAAGGTAGRAARERRRALARDAAEDHDLGQRVRAQPVGAVDADAGALAGRVQPGQRGLGVAVARDAAHRVVHRGPHRDRLRHRVHADEGARHLGDQRQALVDLLRAQVAQVQVHRVALRGGDGVALAFLVPEGLRQAVARAELHRLGTRPGVGRAQAVVLQVAVAVAVDEDRAFAAAAFGDQDAGAGQRGRVVLHELHVAQCHAVAVGHGHAVAGDDAGVGVLRVHAPGTTGGQHHGPGQDAEELAAGDLDGDHAAHAAVFDQQVGDEELVVAPDARKPQRGLEQRVQHVEAGLVGREPRALHLHAAEEAHVDAAVGLAAPGAAPVLQLHHLGRALLDEELHRVLVAQPLAAGDGVVEVVRQRIVATHHAGRAAFGRHRVAAHRHHLRQQRHAQPGIGLHGGDGSAQAGTAAAHHHHVALDDFHAAAFAAPDGAGAS